ncbi:MAG TPA: hypothetical protein VH082_06635 [Rudaea sp.]|nr:hypothetical protein [Rudaea sp.]
MTAAKAGLFFTMCAMLTACATAPTKPVADERFDAQKVVLVNQWAEAHGAKLIWIHYPTRETAQNGD